MTRLLRPSRRRRGPAPSPARRGHALLLVLLVTIVAVALALASATQAATGRLIQNSSERTTRLEDVALSGLELARDRLNAGQDSVPAEGFGTLESGVAISGLPGVTRSTWVSRLGNTDGLSNAGEYGVQAELVTRVADAAGNVTIRRAEVYQESFARYASFSNVGKGANGATLWWALGAQAQGPVHSNDTIYVWNGTPQPQAVFHHQVTTARIILNRTAAEYRGDPPKEKVPVIPLPTTAELDRVKAIAAKAGYVFTPTLTVGDSANATMRIEFVAIDVNGDGNTTGADEGYFRVYQQTSTAPYGAGYAMGAVPVPPADPLLIPGGAATVVDSLLFSPNCGVVATVGGRQAVPTTFRRVPVIVGAPNYRARMLDKQTAFDNVNARCFLGGDDRLSPTGEFQPTDSAGSWMLRTSGTVPAAVAARPDGAYLWPLSPAYNADFRGVIFAEGRVAVSGVVRGRVTISARTNIILAHDLVQATSPATASGNCRADDDIVGLFAGQYILYADNALQAPQRRRDNSTTGAAWMARKDFDHSPRRPDMAVHAAMMALHTYGAERPNPPAGLPAGEFVNRGTVRVIGGLISNFIGQTGTMSGSSLHGVNEDLSFNRCALPFPPPYFPTTGRWKRSQFFEVNPVGFSPSTWFAGR
ncbi:MAG: DUF4900 domain-containing protein [Gemmatimonadetes bacterium]|nr:DUF4900 domain-containing protein [Gemmatimonadota bacterium]